MPTDNNPRAPARLSRDAETLRWVIAGAWCAPETERHPMPPGLVDAIAERIEQAGEFRANPMVVVDCKAEANADVGFRVPDSENLCCAPDDRRRNSVSRLFHGPQFNEREASGGVVAKECLKRSKARLANRQSELSSGYSKGMLDAALTITAAVLCAAVVGYFGVAP